MLSDEESFNERRRLGAIQCRRYNVLGNKEATLRDKNDIEILLYSNSVCECYKESSKIFDTVFLYLYVTTAIKVKLLGVKLEVGLFNWFHKLRGYLNCARTC